MFSARERYIVHGVLDYWAPVSEGVPAELAEVS
jgi:sortase A